MRRVVLKGKLDIRTQQPWQHELAVGQHLMQIDWRNF